MKVEVNPKFCLGCGLCEVTAPQVFKLGIKPYAQVLLNPVPEKHQAAVREAQEYCPEGAIKIS
jgi:ferredoxin